MTKTQTLLICGCVLTVPLIEISYREWEKAPARKAAREAISQKKYQDEWGSAKTGLLRFQQACRDYFHDTSGKRGDVAAFQQEASLWLGPVTHYINSYQKTPTFENTYLTGFLPEAQPAISNPSDETIRAAWVMAEKVCVQFGIK